jgi:hypothetical protein
LEYNSEICSKNEHPIQGSFSAQCVNSQEFVRVVSRSLTCTLGLPYTSIVFGEISRWV